MEDATPVFKRGEHPKSIRCHTVLLQIPFISHRAPMLIMRRSYY